MEAENFGKIHVYQCVAAQNDKRLIEKSGEVLDLLHPAGRTNRLTLDLPPDHVSLEGICHLHTEAISIAEVLFDHRRQMAGVHHYLLYPMGLEMLDQELHDRLTPRGDLWFGKNVCMGPNSRSLPRR